MEAGTAQAFIGLGSNIAYQGREPVALLSAAVDALHALGRVHAVSSIYATEPVGFADQPAFLNAVAALETGLAPEELLDQLLLIERAFGRNRAMGERNGPRTLDLDLLLLGNTVLATDRLTLPHPRLAERRFVLAPLVEIAPGLPHPVLGRTVKELQSALPRDGENGVDAVRCLGRLDPGE